MPRARWPSCGADYSGASGWQTVDATAAIEDCWLAKSQATTYVGMHAANLWVYKARGLQTTNMRAGDAWFPAGDRLIAGAASTIR